jgi:hypothetical protein
MQPLRDSQKEQRSNGDAVLLVNITASAAKLSVYSSWIWYRICRRPDRQEEEVTEPPGRATVKWRCCAARQYRASCARKTNFEYIEPQLRSFFAGDQTEQEEEETQPLRDPRKERRSTGDAAAAQYQRKSAKKTRPVEETSEEDEESVRKRREKGKAKEVEGGWND